MTDVYYTGNESELTLRVKNQLSRINAPIGVTTCIVEDDAITLTILHNEYEDDRQNVIDIEGEPIAEAIEIIDHKAALQSDTNYYLILNAISTVLKMELL